MWEGIDFYEGDNVPTPAPSEISSQQTFPYMDGVAVSSYNEPFVAAGANVGDRVRITVEGVVVKRFGEFAVDLPNETFWHISRDHKVTILERAKPKDIYQPGTVIEATLTTGVTYKYLKQDNGLWAYLSRIDSFDFKRTWEFLLNNYDNGKRIKVLAPTTPVA